MEEKINQLHQLIKAIYPDAVSVNISVDIDGIKVVPVYMTNRKYGSMRTLTGNWIKKDTEI